MGNRNGAQICLVLLGLCIVLLTCSPAEPTPAEMPALPVDTSTPVPPSPTATATVTKTPIPTMTLEPSSTPVPTSTPVPSLTLTPTPDFVAQLGEFTRLGVEADQLYYSGDYQGAIEIYDQMLAMEVSQEGGELVAIAYLNRGGCHTEMNAHEAAIADYEMAIDLGQSDPAMFNNLCWSYTLTGDPESGLPFCEQAIEIDPDPAYLDSRAVACGLMGDDEGSMADLQLVLDQLAATKELELRELRAERRIWLAILKTGESPFIPAVIERLREDELLPQLEGEDVDADPLFTALNHYWRGRMLFSSNRIDESIEAYTRAIELYPEFQEAYFFRGVAYRIVEQPELALADYGQAVSLASGDAQAYYLHGLTAGTLGDFEQSVNDYTAAIMIDPEESEYYASRGSAYLALGRAEEGLADFGQVLELEPLNAMVRFYRGLTYANLGDVEAAVEDLERVLEILEMGVATGWPPEPGLEEYIEELLDDLKS